MTSISTDRVGGNLIPEGIHPFKVTEFEEREGPKGTYWNFTCKIEGNSPFAGQQTWVVISLGDQSRWKAEQWLDCFEIPEGMEIEGEEFVGMTFRGKVIHEEGKDGKIRAKVDEFLPSQKVKLTKSTGSVKPAKKHAQVTEEADEEDTDDEDAETETGEDTEEEGTEEDADAETEEDADEEDDDEDAEEEVQRPAKKSVKPAAKPAPIAKKPVGKLPKPKSKFKRPF